MLTELNAKNAKPRDKRFKLYDGRGLYLLVNPSGSKRWEFRYKFPGAEGKLVHKTLSLGTFEEVGLKAAREKTQAARQLLNDFVDPAAEKAKREIAAQFNAQNTFTCVAKEWFDTMSPSWTPTYGKKLWRRLEMHIFPMLGHRPIGEIGPLDILKPLKALEAVSKTHMARTLLQICQAICRYAVVTQRIKFNPARELEGALRKHSVRHYPSIDPREIKDFIEKLNTSVMSERDRLAVSILLLTMLRTGEMRKSRRSDVNFEESLWEIDKGTVKTRIEHVVPLSRQALILLRRAHELSKGSEYLFPPLRPHKNPYMHENAINEIIKRMGYKGKIVGHGFRSLSSTTLNKFSHDSDAIEMQLSHTLSNPIRAIYNRYKYVESRRQILQWWADHLEDAGLKID